MLLNFDFFSVVRNSSGDIPMRGDTLIVTGLARLSTFVFRAA